MNAIATIEPTASVVLFEADKFNVFFAKLKADVEATPIDLSTDRGRKAIASAAAKVRSEKASIDKDRLRLTKEWRDMTAQVNGAWKTIEAQLDELAVEARRPLTEWEAAEKARVQRCQAAIDGFKRAGVVTLDDTAATVRERGADVWQQEIGGDFGDMAAEAQAAKDGAVDALKAALARLTREEAERAELEKLRAEKEERDAEEAAKRALEEAAESKRAWARQIIEYIGEVGRGMIGGKTYPYIILIRELEEKIAVSEGEFGDMAGEVERARSETLARVKEAQAAQAERSLREAAERAAQEAREAEARKSEEASAQRQREHDEALAAERRRAEEAERAAQAERDRAAQEIADREAAAAAEAAEQARREKNRAHRGQIMGEAKLSIMAAGEITDAAAVAIVKAIVAGSIPHVTLRF